MEWCEGCFFRCYCYTLLVLLHTCICLNDADSAQKSQNEKMRMFHLVPPSSKPNRVSSMERHKKEPNQPPKKPHHQQQAPSKQDTEHGRRKENEQNRKQAKKTKDKPNWIGKSNFTTKKAKTLKHCHFN